MYVLCLPSCRIFNARTTRGRSLLAAIMEAMRESWTDARLDDFRAETARRFEEAKVETARRFDKVETDLRDLRGETHLRFDRVEGRIDALQRTIIVSNAAIFAAVLGVLATQL